MRRTSGFSAAAGSLVCSACYASHSHILLFDEERLFANVVAPQTTLDFTGFPPFTAITDQYADHGAVAGRHDRSCRRRSLDDA